MDVLFWDFDGTLVHSEHLWSGSMYKALLTVAPDTSMTFEQVRIANRSGFTWQAPECAYTDRVGEAWWEDMYAHYVQSYTRFGVPLAIAQDAAALVRGIIKQPEHYHLYPDTLSTLTACKARGYCNVLLSNNYPDLEDILKALGLDTLLDGIVLSAREGYEKPHPQLFKIAKSRFPASSYTMIGDNEDADIVGGQNAAMRTVYIHKGASARADYSFDRLSDITDIL